MILSGYPFAANPLAGLWYPPGWLALVFPLPLGLNLVAVLHLLFGGVGVYRLSRVEGAGHSGALLAGMAFESMPKLVAHFGAGHLTLLYAVPWTPWLLYVQRRRQAAPKGGRPGVISPGLILGLIFLADVRWAAFAGLVWLAYALLQPPGQPSGEGPEGEEAAPVLVARRRLVDLVRQLALGVLIAAPLALPFMEYLGRSTRNSLSASDTLVYSLPLSRVLGLVFPDPGGFQEWMLYPGGAVFALAVLGACWRPAGRRSWFWIGVFVAAILWAFGENIPWNSALAQLPGFGLLRVPPRSLFLAGMGLAMLAGQSVTLLNGSPNPAQRRWANLAGSGLVFFSGGLVLSVRLMVGEWVANLIWGALVLILAVGAILISLRRQQPRMYWLWAVMGLSLLDWAILGTTLVEFRDPELVLGQQREVVSYLDQSPGLHRIYSPSYSLPQQVGARHALELADGVDPLQVAAYARFLEGASGIPITKYGVTLPPLEGNDPSRANQAYNPDPELLGRLNVRFVLSDFDLAVTGLEMRVQVGRTRIYENLLARPRAWLQPEAAIQPGDWEGVDMESWSPNRIALKASGPGTLVISEIAYPGWQAQVDGAAADILVIGGLFRGVELAGGSHRVDFTFRPFSLYIGLAMALFGWAYLILRMVPLALVTDSKRR